MSALDAAPNPRLLLAQLLTAIGVAGAMAAVAVAVMAVVDAITVKVTEAKATTMQSHNPFLSQWHAPAQTGVVMAVDVAVATEEDVVVISNQPMIHRKTQHRRNSQRLARNLNPVSVMQISHVLTMMERVGTMGRTSNLTRLCLDTISSG